MTIFFTQRILKAQRACSAAVGLAFFLLSSIISLHVSAQEATEIKPESVAEPVVAEVFEFDHFNTGFALEGMHATLECESCHSRGQFEGTPSLCADCHSEGSAVNASALPQNHIQVIGQCDDCHTPQEWTFVSRVDHASVLGSCGSCHNNFLADGKPSNHLPTSNNCDFCHNTVEWVTVNFDHSETTASCTTCHNGSDTAGKPSDHITTSDLCESCHQTNFWSPVPSNEVDHDEVYGTCFSCHKPSGKPAPGKPSGHLEPTSNTCEACHSNASRPSWIPVVRVDHNEIPTNDCSLCHSKPVDHIIASENCESCHLSTIEWFVNPQTGVDHTEIDPAQAGACAFCHNGTIAIGQHADHIPTAGAECINCHQPNEGWAFDPR